MAVRSARRWRFVSLCAAIILLGIAVAALLIIPSPIDTTHVQVTPVPTVLSFHMAR